MKQKCVWGSYLHNGSKFHNFRLIKMNSGFILYQDYFGATVVYHLYICNTAKQTKRTPVFVCNK